MPDDNKLYARAHRAIEDKLPYLKGERLRREDWYRHLNINPNLESHKPLKEAVNIVLWNMAQNKNKLIIKEGSYYKVLDDTLTPIDFLSSGGDVFDMEFPFGIHEKCFLYRKNIMVVFGSKDAGKTAILLNIIRLNMCKHRTLYFSSEMVSAELKGRLARAKGMTLADWHFKAFERSYDFDQVIDPDGLNIIDFLELGGDDTEYFKGVALIRRIYDKLDNGVAIIGCQKNANASLPKGGAGLLEKARIALNLDRGKATLAVAKNWTNSDGVNPRGLSWTYQIVGGINLVNVEDAGYASES